MEIFGIPSLPRRRSYGFVTQSFLSHVRGAGTRDEPLRMSAWEATGLPVLDSVRYTTDTSLLLKKFYHLREASASLAAAISACWMLQEENEGYVS